jgi:hypothetical protein
MKQTIPVRGPAPAHREAAHHAQADLRVRYYFRMKLQRVYPLVVEVPRGTAARPVAGHAPDPVIVRAVVPGAHVVPAEQRLDVTRPGETAKFYVTPLARGRLPGPHVEVFQHGRRIQDIPLRMKGVTQRATWILLALTLLLPAVVFYYTRSHKLSGDVPYQAKNLTVGKAGEDEKKDAKEGEEDKKDKPDDQNKAKPDDQNKKEDNKGAALSNLNRLLALADDDKKEDKPAAKDESKKDTAEKTEPKKDEAKKDEAKKDEAKKDEAKKDEAKKDEPKKDEPKKDDKAGQEPTTGRGGPGGRGSGGGRGGPMGGPGGGPPRMGSGGMGPGGGPPRMGPGGPGGQGLPLPPGAQEADPPLHSVGGTVKGSPGEVLERALATEVRDDFGTVPVLSEQVIPWIGSNARFVYDLTCNLPSTYLYVGLFVFTLTVISWFLHRPRRSSRWARIELSTAPASMQAQETLPLGPGDARPLNIEPA